MENTSRFVKIFIEEIYFRSTDSSSRRGPEDLISIAHHQFELPRVIARNNIGLSSLSPPERFAVVVLLPAESIQYLFINICTFIALSNVTEWEKSQVLYFFELLAFVWKRIVYSVLSASCKSIALSIRKPMK